MLQKARWILETLALVQAVAAEGIVTGSRIAYLGRLGTRRGYRFSASISGIGPRAGTFGAEDC